ncbi:hypothetical protein B0H17DRAFT_1201839 [Mycena rosella]|uniref:Uncharacterized protein n=1 Tax=Mycena rosella TaxID=1033263 RepID=A0AAD7DIE1_MYCRO|nr:hypothetical protein B0H17DRAFT_1201839 [Mycena rosella]
MSYDPESTVTRPLALTSPCYAPHPQLAPPPPRPAPHRRRRARLLAFFAVLAPTVGLLKEYYQRPLPAAGNAPPPPTRPDGHAPLDGPPSSHPFSSDNAEDAVAALYAAQLRTLAVARALRAQDRAGPGDQNRGLTAIRVLDEEAHLPGYQGTYFDGAWEIKINKFASALPPLTVPINGRNEPRVVFDTLPLFKGGASLLLAPCIHFTH